MNHYFRCMRFSKIFFLALFSLNLVATVIQAYPNSCGFTRDTSRQKLYDDEPNLQIESIPIPSIRYALMLDTTIESVKNHTLANFVCSWLTTPYLFGGDSEEGIDCSAFSRKLIQTIYGQKLPRTVGEQFNRCVPVTEEALQEGDLVFFHTTRTGLSHVGVYIGNHRFVHASTSKGVIIDNLRSNYYSKAYRCAGRISE
jgi:hypothetical protein